MKGLVKSQSQPGFSGFIIPPEILAFECIPNLRRRFRKDVGGAHPGCPRMCKRRFVKGDNKGFPLQDIHDALGSTKEIESILEPTEEERALMRQILEVDADDGMGYIDLVVESWREHLVVQKKPIFWKEFHKKDVEARSLKMIDAVGVGEKEKSVEHPESLRALQSVLVGEIGKGFGKLMGAVSEVNARVVEKLNVLETKVNTLHAYVLGQRMVVTGQGIHSDRSFLLMSPIDSTLVVPTRYTHVEEKGHEILAEEKSEEEDARVEKDKEEKTQEEEKEKEEKEKEEKKEEGKDKKRKKREETVRDDSVIATGVKRKKKGPVRFSPEETKRKKK